MYWATCRDDQCDIFAVFVNKLCAMTSVIYLQYLSINSAMLTVYCYLINNLQYMRSSGKK